MNVHVTPLVPPVPVGEGAPGDLLLDLPAKRLWGVVDPSVDPAGAVLLSDIDALAAQLDAAVAEANAYTDTQILTRAPSSHTHPSTQITDFAAAVQAVVNTMTGVALPIGMIAMYAGLPANIGVNEWADWHLCDGSGGTPDLRDKFVLCAAGAPGGTNPASSLVTDDQGQHQHTAVTGYYTLTTTDIPSHTHGPGSLSGSISGTAASAGAHTHTIGSVAITGQAGPANVAVEDAYATGGNISVDSAGAHTHSVSGSCAVTGGASAAIGGNGAHRHTISPDGLHHHSITSAQLKNTLPYYALAYIMKVS